MNTYNTFRRVRLSHSPSSPFARWMELTLLIVFMYKPFVGLPKDSDKNTGIVVFVNRLTKMIHVAVQSESIDSEDTDQPFCDRTVF